MSRINNYMPEKITAEQWINLLDFNTPKARYDYMVFLRQKELRSKKDETKKLSKIKTLTDQKIIENDYNKQNLLHFPLLQISYYFLLIIILYLKNKLNYFF